MMNGWFHCERKTAEMAFFVLGKVYLSCICTLHKRVKICYRDRLLSKCIIEVRVLFVYSVLSDDISIRKIKPYNSDRVK